LCEAGVDNTVFDKMLTACHAECAAEMRALGVDVAAVPATRCCVAACGYAGPLNQCYVDEATACSSSIFIPLSDAAGDTKNMSCNGGGVPPHSNNAWCQRGCAAVHTAAHELNVRCVPLSNRHLHLVSANLERREYVDDDDPVDDVVTLQCRKGFVAGPVADGRAQVTSLRCGVDARWHVADADSTVLLHCVEAPPGGGVNPLLIILSLALFAVLLFVAGGGARTRYMAWRRQRATAARAAACDPARTDRGASLLEMHDTSRRSSRA
jgi:hypothetical protein